MEFLAKIPYPYALSMVVAIVIISITLIIVPKLFGKGKKTRDAGNQIVLLGPSGSGKTALFTRLVHDVLPATVPSMKVASGNVVIGNKTYSLVDVPGNGQMKNTAVGEAQQSRAVIFVVDASVAETSQHYKQAADVLYDLLTSVRFVNSGTPILLLANKTDVEGAKTAQQVQKILESELERLKVARPAIATVGDDGDAETLLLGSVGQPFTFAADASVPFTAKAAAVGKSDAPLRPVVEFLESL